MVASASHGYGYEDHRSCEVSRGDSQGVQRTETFSKQGFLEGVALEWS